MEPKISRKGPYPVNLEAGKTYHYCTCGLSNDQPFCDGSHENTEFKPLSFTTRDTGTKFLCGCRQSKKPPYCDGFHRKL